MARRNGRVTCNLGVYLQRLIYYSALILGGEQHSRAFSRQSPGDCGAKALCGASDQRLLADEPFHTSNPAGLGHRPWLAIRSASSIVSTSAEPPVRAGSVFRWRLISIRPI